MKKKCPYDMMIYVDLMAEHEMREAELVWALRRFTFPDVLGKVIHPSCRPSFKEQGCAYGLPDHTF